MVLSMNRWVGKVAIVTGASSGIGAAIADQLVEDGLIVVGLARRSERIEKRAQELKGKKGKLHAIKTDLSKEEEILAAFKWTEANLGPIHILINNAGVISNTTLIDGDTENWRKILDVNVMALCIATREAIKSMKKNKINGHIIHINSIGGHIVPNFPALSVYPGSKHAVTALTETLRQEINREQLKIKVTSVSPGGVLTEMITGSFLDENTKKMIEQMPLLQSVDVSDSVRYALSTPEHVQVHELIIKPVGEMF